LNLTIYQGKIWYATTFEGYSDAEFIESCFHDDGLKAAFNEANPKSAFFDFDKVVNFNSSSF
jgi:hypothetical protein